MIFPNKLIPFQDTVLKKSIYVLKNIPVEGIDVMALYEIIKKKFDSILEFQQALDLLFCINKIELKGEVICLLK